MADYARFSGEESGYQFVSSTDSLKRKKYCISREEYTKGLLSSEYKCIEFLSLQVLGSFFVDSKISIWIRIRLQK